MLEELGQGGEELLAEGPACWRTRFVTKGLVVRYRSCPEKLFYSTGGKFSSRLWPLEEKRSDHNVPYWCLKPIVYASEMEWRTLLRFDAVEVFCVQRICPLVWFILNGWRASCAQVPKGALYTVRDLDSPPQAVPLLQFHAECGWKHIGRDEMQLLLTLEYQQDTSGKKLPQLKVEATQLVLACSTEDAAMAMEAAFTQDDDSDAALMEVFASDAAADCIGKDDLRTARKLREQFASDCEVASKHKQWIRNTRKRFFGPRRPPKFLGDRSITRQEVMEMVPPRTYVRRDNVYKRWQLFYGRADPLGWRWSVSRAWGPTGNEARAVRHCLESV